MAVNTSQMLPVGSVVDRYRVVRHLASGGFGNTYEVEHTALGQRRAMKEFYMRDICLRQGTDSTVAVTKADHQTLFDSQRAKFRKEAQRLYGLQHPNIIHVYDLFDSAATGTTYYVMDLVEGESLDDVVLRRGALPEAEVRLIMSQVLSALGYIHSLQPVQLLHLDLKPANLMMDATGHITLIDFGSSKQLDANGARTLTSSAMSLTPGYAPSEQLAGNLKRIGPWTDFYALGATLYNLLTAQRPPEADDVKLDGEAVFNFPATVSIHMKRLIFWLMQDNLRQRPQSAAEIEQQISQEKKEAEDDESNNGSDTSLPPEQNLPPVDTGTIVVGGQTQSSGDGTVLVGDKKSAKNKSTKGIWVVAVPLCLLVLGGILFRRGGCATPPPDIDTAASYAQGCCPDENHPHLIDLGLPSGTKWACCNVGASKPEEYGGYYAWGETSTKSTYDWNTYLYGSSEYNVQNIGRDIAYTQYDVAHTQWGGSWRMPTISQCQELIDHASSEWTTLNGREGCKFTAPNGNYVFLPAGGWQSGDGKFYFARYWSSSLHESFPNYAQYFQCSRDFTYTSFNNRCVGLGVRPVQSY